MRLLWEDQIKVYNESNHRKQERKDKKIRGECYRCTSSAKIGYSLCEYHVEDQRKYRRKRVQKFVDENRCVLCGGQENILSIEEDKQPQCETCYLKKTAQTHFNTSEVWILLKNKLQEQNYLCPYTGELLILRKNAHLEHKLPKARFPHLANDIENVEWVMDSINFMKHDKTKDEFLALIHLIHTNTNR